MDPSDQQMSMLWRWNVDSDPIEVHVATDSSEEIDDQLCIQYLRSLSQVPKPLSIKFIFTGTAKVSSKESAGEWMTTFEEHVVSQQNPNTNVSFTTLEEYSSSGSHNPDFFLQIAPMKDYTGENLEVKGKYILAGDYVSDTPSFNMLGSEAITKKFFDQGKLVDIPSPHMATMRFNEELLSKFTGPFNEYIVFTAFKLAFGRMHPKCPVAQKFAEGLVNPDVGRGVNYKSVMTIAKNLDVPSMPSFYTHTEPYDALEAKKYFKDIFGDDWKDTNGSICKLNHINYILHYINVFATGIRPSALFHDNGGEVFYSNFTVDTIPELLKPSWEYFKANASKLIDCYNPVYDLFAGYVMVGLINGETRVEHSVEEFLEKIVKEF